MKNSCLYACTVMHHRLEPIRNRFQYRFFMFCLDLDEIDEVVDKSHFISRNRFNLFNFRDHDHLQLPKENPDRGKQIREHVLTYLEENRVDRNSIGKILLVTNLCTLGYQFNPVSFYYCFDRKGPPLCSLVEVGNTFGELKLFFLGGDAYHHNKFTTQASKHFYVSPFMDLDTDFHFVLGIPAEKLSVTINDYLKGNKIFLSTLTGSREPLTDANLLKYAFRVPFVTIQIITMIHWQAFKLWLRKLSHHKKNSFTELQKNVLRPHKSLTQ